ncbi:MAG: DUF996 domain-containing protein [Candidatus Bathyarchaeia archaeon]|jgi:uncharacterized membrane protein
MSFESGKTLGKISSLLTVILPVIVVPLVVLFMFLAVPVSSTGAILPAFVLPYVALAGLGLVSFILFLLAMHNLSKYYNRPAIFKNVLYGIIVNIVGVIVVLVVESAFLTIVTRQVHVDVPNALSNGPLAVSSVQSVFLPVVSLLLTVFIFGIISAFFYMRAFNALSEESGVTAFRTAGVLYLIGTVLTLVMVGALLVWVAWIFVAIGFFSLNSSPKTAPVTSTNSSAEQLSSSTSQMKYCTYCGAPNNTDDIYCNRCGRSLTT